MRTFLRDFASNGTLNTNMFSDFLTFDSSKNGLMRTITGTLIV